jgi:hypothetical protein
MCMCVCAGARDPSLQAMHNTCRLTCLETKRRDRFAGIPVRKNALETSAHMKVDYTYLQQCMVIPEIITVGVPFRMR